MADAPEKDPVFAQPEWMRGGLSDPQRMEESLPPGAYAMPGRGADYAITQLISQFSPLIAMLARAGNLDQRIVDAITKGMATLGTRGSMTAYTNPANILFNQDMARQVRGDMGAYHDAVGQSRQLMLTNLYQRIGDYSDKDAQMRAQAAKSGPMGLMADALFTQFDFRGLQRGLTGAWLTGGVELGSDADRRSRGALFNTFSGMLATQFGGDPFAFGGLKGKDVGQLAATMAQRGQLDFRAGDAAGRGASMAKKVQEMAVAIAPLREVFDESIPQLMDRLDQALGVSSATFSTDEIRNRVLRMKHTARLTGVSMETMMGMAQASGQMLSGIGLTGMGSDLAATQAAAMLGSGVNLARIDVGGFRERVLRDVTGQQASQAAKEMSGAFMLAWKGGKLGTDQAAAIAQFRGLVGEDMSTNNMLKVLGGLGVTATAGDIRAAGRTEAAEDLRTGTDLVGGIGAARYKEARGYSASWLRRAGGTGAGGAVWREMADLVTGGGLKTEADVRAFLATKGMKPEQMEPLIGQFNTLMERGAQSQGFKTWREMEAFNDAEKRAAEIKTRSDQLAKAEKELPIGTRYGMLGVMTGKGTKFGNLVADLMGVPTIDRARVGAGMLAISEAGGAKAALVDDMLKAAYLGTDAAGNTLDEGSITQFKEAIRTGKAEDIVTASQNLFMQTEEGKKALEAFEAGGYDAGGTEEQMKDYMGADAATRKKMVEASVLRGAVGSVLGTKAQKDLKATNIEEFLGSAAGLALSDTDKDKLRKENIAQGAKLGLKLADDPADVLKQILDFLKKAMPQKKETEPTGNTT